MGSGVPLADAVPGARTSVWVQGLAPGPQPGSTVPTCRRGGTEPADDVPPAARLLRRRPSPHPMPRTPPMGHTAHKEQEMQTPGTRSAPNPDPTLVRQRETTRRFGAARTVAV